MSTYRVVEVIPGRRTRTEPYTFDLTVGPLTGLTVSEASDEANRISDLRRGDLNGAYYKVEKDPE